MKKLELEKVEEKVETVPEPKEISPKEEEEVSEVTET